jgi:hypothetical protein
MTTRNVFNALDPAGVTSTVYGGGSVRRLPLTDAKSDAGVALTATAGSDGAMGVERSSGASLFLAGHATTSGTTQTNQAFFETVLPDTYQGSSGGTTGADIPVTVNAAVLGSGTIVASGTTLALGAFVYSNGVEESLTVSPTSLAISGAAADYGFVINGGTVVPEARIGLELTMAIDTSSGANTGTINKVEYTA